MTDSYVYGGAVAAVSSAAGVKGVLLRAADGTMIFRMYHEGHAFTDYEIRHDELSITIDAEALAAFYHVGGRSILDHGPQVLGLRKLESA